MPPKRTPYLIGIAGPSGAGKTELARKLAGSLSAPIVSLDCYYRDLAHLPLEERARANFDVPDALDHALLVEQLVLLAQGAEIARPVYDFALHVRAPAVERVPPGKFAIVEGLLTLHWEDVRGLFGTKVYVHAEDEICFTRRLERDVRERGRSCESVEKQYRETVRPMAELYTWPTRRWADVVVRGTDPLEQSAAAVLEHVERQFSRPLAAGA